MPQARGAPLPALAPGPAGQPCPAPLRLQPFSPWSHPGVQPLPCSAAGTKGLMDPMNQSRDPWTVQFSRATAPEPRRPKGAPCVGCRAPCARAEKPAAPSPAPAVCFGSRAWLTRCLQARGAEESPGPGERGQGWLAAWSRLVLLPGTPEQCSLCLKGRVPFWDRKRGPRAWPGDSPVLPNSDQGPVSPRLWV